MSESSTSKGNELIGQTIDRGRYEVLRVIGEGGMGRVFEAKQVNIGRLVAIKVLHRHWAQDPKLLERFKREALTASQFRHPNTVMVYDYGETERGEFYIIMELLQGQSLLSLLDQEGPLSLDRTLKIIEQVCGALSEVHRCGVIHRDLKPENIQIDPRDGHPDFVKLLDFSIAKIVNDNTLSEANKKALTLQGAVFGTPQYMSPEQVRGKPLDHRTDIYALGVIFYQMLTGHVPFASETPQGTMMAHLTDPVPDPCALFPELEIHPEASRLIQDCLIKDPKKRVESSEELSRRVKELAARLELEDPAQHTDVNPSVKVESAELKAIEKQKDHSASDQGAGPVRRYVTQETEQFDAKVHLTPSSEAKDDTPDQGDNQKAGADAGVSASEPDESARGDEPALSEPPQSEEPIPASEPSPAPAPAMTMRGFGGAFQSTDDLKPFGEDVVIHEQGVTDEINPSEDAPVPARARGFLDESVPTGIHGSMSRGKSRAWPLLLTFVFVGGGVSGWWFFKDQLSALLKPPPPRASSAGHTINISTGARDTTYRVESMPQSAVYDLKGERKSDRTPYSFTQSTSAVSRLILKAKGYEDQVITVGFTTSKVMDTNGTRLIKVALTQKIPRSAPTNDTSAQQPPPEQAKKERLKPKVERKKPKRVERKKPKRVERKKNKTAEPTKPRTEKVQKRSVTNRGKSRTDRSPPKKVTEDSSRPPSTLDPSPPTKATPPPKELKVTAEDIVIDEPPKTKRKPFAPAKIQREVPELRGL